jgi:hypothetical protein
VTSTTDKATESNEPIASPDEAMVRADAYRTGDWRRRFGTSSTTRRYWVTGLVPEHASSRPIEPLSSYGGQKRWNAANASRKERNKFDALMSTTHWTTKSTMLGLGLWLRPLNEYDPEIVWRSLVRGRPRDRLEYVQQDGKKVTLERSGLRWR